MKSNRRKFLTKSTVVAAAVALPSAAQAQTTAGAKPVKRVHYASGKPPGTPQWVPNSLLPPRQRLSAQQIVDLAKKGTPDSDLIDMIRHSRLEHVIGVGGMWSIRTQPVGGLSGSQLAHLREEGLSDAVLDALQAQFLAQFIEAERLRYQNWGHGPGSMR